MQAMHVCVRCYCFVIFSSDLGESVYWQFIDKGHHIAIDVLEYGCTTGIGIAMPELGTTLVTYTAARLCYMYISSYSTLAFLKCL
jgi:hypothetical protein